MIATTEFDGIDKEISTIADDFPKFAVIFLADIFTAVVGSDPVLFKNLLLAFEVHHLSPSATLAGYIVLP